MGRLALAVTFALAFTLGKLSSPETRRSFRWWLERMARHDGSDEAKYEARKRKARTIADHP